MSGGSGNDEDKNKPISFEEQIRLLRRSSNKQLQKTTEINVGQKLKRELNQNEPALDQALVDQRLQDTLNRESQQELFKDSLVASVFGEKKKKKRSTGVHAAKDAKVPPVAETEPSNASGTPAIPSGKEAEGPAQSAGSGNVAQQRDLAARASRPTKEFVVKPRTNARSFFESEETARPQASAPPVVPYNKGGGFFDTDSGTPAVPAAQTETPSSISQHISQEAPVPFAFPGVDSPVQSDKAEDDREFEEPASSGVPHKEARYRHTKTVEMVKQFEEPVPYGDDAAVQQGSPVKEVQELYDEAPYAFPGADDPMSYTGDSSEQTEEVPAGIPGADYQTVAEEQEDEFDGTSSELPPDYQSAAQILAQAMARPQIPDLDRELPADTAYGAEGQDSLHQAQMHEQVQQSIQRHEPIEDPSPHPVQEPIQEQIQAQVQEPVEEQVQEPYISPEEWEASERRAELLYYFSVQAQSFKERTGLDMLLDAEDKIQIYLNAAGESQHLYQIECDEAGFAEADVLADTISTEFLSRISKEFGVEFGRPGQLALRQLEPDENNQLVPGESLFVRAPRVDELKALQRAIEFSWPATYQKEDQLPLKVIFLDQPLVKDEYDGVVLKYLEDGRPVLFITPELCRNGMPTEADPIADGAAESWQSEIMRELAWKSAIDCNHLPVDDAATQSLGWVLLKQENEESKLYGLKDANGDIFLPFEDASSNGESWVRCNRQGELIDAKGDPVTEIIEMLFISNEEMQRRAQVKPCGTHFFTPEEELADALRCFRQGPDWRMHLGRSNPLLYKLAKTVDQACINRCYPTENGKDAYIRSSTGQVVENSAASQKDLVQFEQKVNRKPG
jgi:hypothetical protein